jgi:hypothetical protein
MLRCIAPCNFRTSATCHRREMHLLLLAHIQCSIISAYCTSSDYCVPISFSKQCKYRLDLQETRRKAAQPAARASCARSLCSISIGSDHTITWQTNVRQIKPGQHAPQRASCHLGTACESVSKHRGNICGEDHERSAHSCRYL